MSCKKPVFWIIAGTTEGRELVESLSQQDLMLHVSLATEYGLSLIQNKDNIQVSAARLNPTEMVAFIKDKKPDCVIDTTHPYAQKVTADISSACQETGTPYLRLLRPSLGAEDFIYAADTAQAAAILARLEGKAFLTCGSKKIEAFCRIEDFAERLVARVLPTEESINKCRALGFKNANIIGMQGPFSQELNEAMFNATGATILVTKDSGEIGGYPEKIAAAHKLGMVVIVIGRPPEQTEGLSYTELIQRLIEDYHLKIEERKKVCPYFPLFVPLQDKCVKVFGAGQIAARRIAVLAEFGSAIEVIAPTVLEEIRRNKAVQLIQQRSYQKGDCLGADLVVATTNDSSVNAQIALECQQHGILASIADNPNLCTFYFPAVVKQDNMVVGITSSGQDHSRVRRVAQRIRSAADNIFR